MRSNKLALALLIGLCLLPASIVSAQATKPQEPASTQRNPFESVPEPRQEHAPEVSGPTIEAIEFRGAIHMRLPILRALIASRVGDAYNAETLRRDSQALYNTGRFSDIVWETEPGSAGDIVRFVVVERPLIQSIEYQGDDTVTIEEILERFRQRKVNLLVQSLCNKDELPRATATVQEFVAERGRQNITVTPLVEPIGPSSTVKITFRVEEKQVAAPKFEVAVVKQCNPSDPSPSRARGGASGNDPGRLRIACQTVERLIQWAYVTYVNGEPARFPPVSDRTIEGSPSWVRSETFTIEAKPEVPQTIEMMRGPMLQALLEDRFKLKIHRGTKQVPIYALTVASGGPKLDAAKKDSCTAPPDFSKGIPPPLTPDQPPPCGAFSPDGKGGTRTFGQTLAGLTWEFSAQLGRRVDDRTGIEGTFDIHLDVDYNGLFTRFDRPSATDDTPRGLNRTDPFEALAGAVQKLGLRLQTANGPETYIVIDHVERPSEN